MYKFLCLATLLICSAVLPSLSHSQVCPAASASQEIPVSGHPFAVVGTADNCWLFVSLSTESGRGGIAILHNNVGSFSQSKVFPLDGSAFGSSLSKDGQTLFVATTRGAVAIDAQALEAGKADAVVGTFRDGDEKSSISVLSDKQDHLLFVSEEGAASIAVFDLSRARANRFTGNALIGRIPVGISPVGLALSPDGRSLYATSQLAPPVVDLPANCEPETPRKKRHPMGLLLRIDLGMAETDPAHAVTKIIPAGCNPVRVVVGPSGEDIWVTARGDDALLRFSEKALSASTGKSGYSKFSVGSSPVGLALKSDDTQIWVALSDRFGKSGSGGIANFAVLGNGTITGQHVIQTNGFPREMTFLSDGSAVVTTIFDAQKISVSKIAP